jgi:hypothetical protein
MLNLISTVPSSAQKNKNIIYPVDAGRPGKRQYNNRLDKVGTSLDLTDDRPDPELDRAIYNSLRNSHRIEVCLLKSPLPSLLC